MADVESGIRGSGKLVEIFGYWPSFHDAEVINLHLWRGNVDPEKNLYQFPVLTLDLHHWELTKQVDANGFFVREHHTRTTLQFRDLQEFQMSSFNHQNAIFGLSIERLERGEKPSPYFQVRVDPAYGMDSSFECLEVEVISASPCGADGEPAT